MVEPEVCCSDSLCRIRGGSDLGPAWARSGLKGLYRGIVGLATKAPKRMLVLVARASIRSC
jgi:hypothetical protein